ncbi:hypothetical protein LOH54_10560 [Sulfurimonas sp. HSL-3221]|uniref:hypothetical protein n=1 Tax=Sulfurimonadaceae TaxID=2771471 RepID=UPI001E3B5622|nr:hypothetical protein [Sulfurimonas sp. HSL-3221]UFS62088.1 hypothetical protein LOH54_10560 [Sulfurimonas sp. HSL-3221]
MTEAEDLTDLLENDVIPEIESFIDDLYEKIAETKNATEEDKTQLAELQELKKEFSLLLDEVKNGELDEEECRAIIDEIDMMREEEE